MSNTNNLPTEYQSFIHLSRYARWDNEKQRRETWDETVSRYIKFFSEHNYNNVLSTKDKEHINTVIKEDIMCDLRSIVKR